MVTRPPGRLPDVAAYNGGARTAKRRLSMPVTSRSIVVPITAVVLGICATLGALAAFRSPHVGAGVLALAAAIFATAAVGVSRRALWASLFGLFFCSVVGVGVLVVAA